MKTPSKSRSGFSFLREVLVVIIGVLIALLINDWKESNSNSKYLKTIFAAVTLDISKSNEGVNEILILHEALMDSLADNLENDQITIREIIQRNGGLKYPTLKNISLRFLVANKAELVDYQLISLLTDIEGSTSLLNKKFDKLMDFLYDSMEAKDYENKMKFAIFLSEVIDSEKTTLELYDSFLDENSTLLPKEVD